MKRATCCIARTWMRCWVLISSMPISKEYPTAVSRSILSLLCDLDTNYGTKTLLFAFVPDNPLLA